MAKMKKCPACGSEHIMINGVIQRKKGLLYFLSGAAAQDAGTKTGYKMAAKATGLQNNAKCMDCGHDWKE